MGIQMSQRKQARMDAYTYLLRKIREAGHLQYDMSYPESSDDYLSLDEMVKLREGLADPSEELVSASKKLLKSVAGETEINRYLITPFK